MRDLFRHTHLPRSIPVGTLTWVLSLPYIWVLTPPGALRLARVALLLPICLLVSQAETAWTLDLRHQFPPWLSWLARRRWLVLLSLATGSVFITGIFIDPWLHELGILRPPTDLTQMLLALPWLSLFQSLCLVAGVYAVVYRLSRSEVIALGAVVVLHETVLYLQYGERLSSPALIVCIILAGVHGFVLGASYRLCGLVGPCIVSTFLCLRHVPRLF